MKIANLKTTALEMIAHIWLPSLPYWQLIEIKHYF
ncbi:hypothetical protein LYNGBM3L_70400 [Moorena producens 3L]|uniref:Uncharacterized protein n=1 Tax=Moorena producens 3L TaxID=489825 RepID=F4Y2H0_9CYAN|nr:hypothetical protein LYNGBM3L_70400 [Moorena producens 3L]